MNIRYSHLFNTLLAPVLLLTFALAAQAQNGVGIGTTAPDVSAALDIVSSTKGALLPRVASTGSVPSPAAGLLVYQTGGTPGFYYNAGTPGAPSWQQIATASGAAITASNGLTKTGQNVALGGTLTGATTIAQGSNNFSLTGGNVGIGTNTPTSLLDLGSTFGALATDAATRKLAVYNNAAGTDFYGLGASAGTLHLFANAGSGAAPKLSIASSGNVGIGNPGPSFGLDITAPGNLAARLSSASTIGTWLNLTNTSTGGGGFQFISTGSGNSEGANKLLMTTGTGGTNTGFVLTFDGATRNVGIGTNTPGQKLTVSGGIQAATFGTFSGVTGPDQGAHLQWNRSGSEGETWLINHLGPGTGNAGIRFGGITTSTGTTPVEWARFLNNGNFGIGTPTPGNRLAVAGGGGTTIDLTVTGRLRSGDAGNAGGLWVNSAATQFVGQLDANSLGMFNNGAWRLLVGNTGNISMGTGTTPQAQYGLHVNKTQLTADGDGQATAYAYRTRDSQNDGTAYSVIASNAANTGYNFWGDVYTFGTSGFCYNDYTRTGGVLGANFSGLYWGALGYKNSGNITYGVYGSAAYASGAGRATAGGAAPAEGVGLGIYGGALGGWIHGEALGLVSSGRVFAAYNLGDEYTSGRQVEITTTGTGQRQASYSVTAAESKTYGDGVARLQDGRATVAWPAGFAALLGGVPVVTVTPVGECAGLHLVSRDRTGFVVAENGGGRSTLEFTWIAVAPRRDAAAPVPAELLDPAFDANLRQVMVNDNDATQTGAPLWHDGQRTQFNASPASLQRAPKPAR